MEFLEFHVRSMGCVFEFEDVTVQCHPCWAAGIILLKGILVLIQS